MKITQFWDLFYPLESVPKIKCQEIWFRVSGFRFQVSGFTRYASFFRRTDWDARHFGPSGAETRARSEAFQGYPENRRSSWINVFTGMTKKT